jgi:hypothetical protein
MKEETVREGFEPYHVAARMHSLTLLRGKRGGGESSECQSTTRNAAKIGTFWHVITQTAKQVWTVCMIIAVPRGMDMKVAIDEALVPDGRPKIQIPIFSNCAATCCTIISPIC